MSSYAKFLKEILSSKRKLEDVYVVMLMEKCSAILQNKLPQKFGNPGSFTILCTMGGVYFEKALCDSGASINLMSFSIFKKLDLGEIKDTSVSLQFVDQSTRKPKGIIENVLVRVDKFVFPVDFIVLEMKEFPNEPKNLGRPFLATRKAIIDVHQGQLILRVDVERIIFDMQKILRYSGDETSSSCFSIDMINYLTDEFKDDQLIPDSMERCLIKSSTTQDDDPTIRREAEILDKDSEEEEMKSEKVQSKVELKTLPSHLKYVYLEQELFPIIISSSPTAEQENSLIKIPIAPKDLDKTIFTCPHGTYAYKRMPFGLCNALATFQRCMWAIFADMTDKFLEIFMDDFTLFEGIILGHKTIAKGIEVDKAKINLIAGLPPPTTVKGIRSFLGHAGDCVKAFETLKKKLSTAPQRNKLISDAKYYLWDEPYLFKNCADNIIRRCVPEEEMNKILYHCHDGAIGRHYAANRTAFKVLEAKFFWPTLFNDARAYVAQCDRCQRTGNITKRDEIPLQSIQVNELEELRLGACENAKIFKEKTKIWHDKLIRLKSFKIGDQKNGGNKFKVNGHKLKLYYGRHFEQHPSVTLID
ncbi:uncharacterized protein LOC142174389 [Nicotiana tabacum]|uniref:Uncharacterized protein LOC142174389 n=1 Tax=Nicotiana tabacum TaxID=4097 RepID=A0AC58TGC5_TOBAC